MPTNVFRAGLQALRTLLTGGAPAAAVAPAAVAPAASEPVQMTPDHPVTTTEPRLLVAGMTPGTYTFEVVATDHLGIKSDPRECSVEVTPTIK